MIRVCYYKDCGVIYGEKEPLLDKAVTYGLCPKHLTVSQNEVDVEIKKLQDTNKKMIKRTRARHI